MTINLDECKLITGAEYMLLKNPEFKGQTRVDETGMYYMVWESEGILYNQILINILEHETSDLSEEQFQMCVELS
jgi:hypothetical protein